MDDLHDIHVKFLEEQDVDYELLIRNIHERATRLHVKVTRLELATLSKLTLDLPDITADDIHDIVTRYMALVADPSPEALERRPIMAKYFQIRLMRHYTLSGLSNQLRLMINDALTSSDQSLTRFLCLAPSILFYLRPP